MITMRHHIVSLAAVFLALALGIVLGATKVNSPLLVSLQGDRDSLVTERDQLVTTNSQLTAQVGGDAKFAADVSGLAARGTLPSATVVLITTADADPADRDAVLALLKKSGATVSAQLQLTADFTDPARADDLRGIAARSLPAGAKLPEVTDAGTVAGALLASVLVTDKAGKAPSKPEEATAAMTGLSTAGFVTATGTVAPGRLVILLTGSEPADATDGAAERATVIADVATQLKVTAGGVVLAGRSGSESETGVVGAIRSDTAASAAVTTVDNLQTPQGQLASILGLVEQNGGGVGQYGTAASAQSQIPSLAVG